MYFRNYDFVVMEEKTNNIEPLTKDYYKILDDIFIMLGRSLEGGIYRGGSLCYWESEK